MGADGDINGPRKRRRLSPPETGPYVLRQLVDNVPVSTEQGDEGAHITCVEYWNGNLYVGTSLGEVLHFVSLPADAADSGTAEPTFILASRLPIAATTTSSNSHTPTDVQQIIVVPRANKACILCNGVVTFYSLPELSPAYGTARVGNCTWSGALDLNESANEEEAGDPVIMIARQNNLMLVRMGDEPRRVRSIEFPGCLAGARRDNIACVADGHSYSLLDVERRQKIPLSTICSSEEPADYRVEDIPHRDGTPTPVSLAPSNGNMLPNESRIHARSSSLNTLIGGTDDRVRRAQAAILERSLSRTPEPSNGVSRIYSPESSHSNHTHQPSESSRNGSGVQPATQKPLPLPPPSSSTSESSKFKPHVLSPTPTEFLFITGTEASGVGVGMFVNLDGEGTRGTIEFQRYPECIVLDNHNENTESIANNDTEEGYVLAVVSVENDGEVSKHIEAQRWDVDPGGDDRHKSSLSIPLDSFLSLPVGIRKTVSSNQLSFSEVGEIMQMVRLKSSFLRSPPRTPLESADPRTEASIQQLKKEKELFESQEIEQSSGLDFRQGWEAQRNQEEAKIAVNLGYVHSNILLWGGNCIWRVVRNPLALQLENSLRLAQPETSSDHQKGDLKAIINLLDEIDTLVPKTENEFLGLNYVKQKASLVLFAKLISADKDAQMGDMIKLTETALVHGGLDPRIVLLVIPLLREEVLQGPQGIWINRGLAMVVEPLVNPSGDDLTNHVSSSMNVHVFEMLVRYLLSWQKKRGYGSVTDENYVFDSVDAALLHLLLEIDGGEFLSTDIPTSSFVRTELNKLVDNWKGDFNRAIELLERYRRLFVLSRLYQSRKMSKHVLMTWKRIIEGEMDAGGELSVPAAEMQVRKYLVKIRDNQVVEEYGCWLAARNPSLGIKVFADDTSRVKLDPGQVVFMLKAKAPGAVQVYLEHLVFVKNYSQYADDLIGYYLDTVLTVLETSVQARASLAESYSTYRALRPPKPSYLGFISENAPPEHWWQSRLRLLQLLGGESRSQFTSTPRPHDLAYSIPTVLARIEPFQNELVSESIILGSRQGRHHEALHLLTHGLGDYDTAIRYCLFGGFASSYSTSSTMPGTTVPPHRKDLFYHLLKEFLQITDLSDRVERTSDLLTRFAPLYDVGEVLSLVPDSWSVDILSGFLVRVLRGLVAEKREVKVQRALSAGLNLRVGVEMLETSEDVGGGWVEDEDSVRALREEKKKVDTGKGKSKVIVDESEELIGR
ncbi:TGF beta receptor associated protein 1 [Coccidioides immitis RS]|uniref:TGF beta receptor associated protein 1 n=1 Tax=Coccidioides immitis (strain RS) TaxID=246410 RepID=A0A0E1RWL7_COCIM|nr:TGF beta receptor associated protein 1 [Coccidioides immitis RS]EAS32172.1 TGF beta receptor associated protein 1 [Coccidioides immitis RS]